MGEVSQMDLITRIEQYVNLQRILITTLKKTLDSHDWIYLLDVPRQGIINAMDQEWKFFVHGVGIRFECNGIVVDANRHLAEDPGIFDVGRLVDYFSSHNDCMVLVDGKMHDFNYNSGSVLLQNLITKGTIKYTVGDSYILS